MVLKFHNVVTLYGFIENIVDQFSYLKVSRNKFIFLVLYIDDILLAWNDLGLLYDTIYFLNQNFDRNDISEASYILGIEIHRIRIKRRLRLSQKAYIKKVLEKIKMKDCALTVAPIFKEDKFNQK